MSGEIRMHQRDTTDGDLTVGLPRKTTPQQRRAAAITIAANSSDREDAALLLEIVGLLNTEELICPRTT